MRTILMRLWGLLLLLLAMVSPALAGITVTSYRTVAQINGYAPTSQTQYFEQQTLTNVSPATAEVSGDWMGTNAGGTTPTWHYVGSAQATSTTTFNADSMTVTAAGSFAYAVDTTADFVNPTSTTIFAPGAAANYRSFFQADTPLFYTVSVQLNHRGRVRLSSFEGLVVFDRVNVSPTPMIIDLTGTIPAGHYDFLASTSLAAPNFPNGVNQFVASGSFENLTFTLQVPEPDALGAVVVIIVTIVCRRGRSCANMSDP